jgi:glycosyltransferase involved in cell wall biosynthesis
MPRLGSRPRLSIPESYRGFLVIRTHGRVFGIPPFLDVRDLNRQGRLFKHPAVLSAATLDELQPLIDRCQDEAGRPEVIRHYRGYDLVRLRDCVYGVPRAAGAIDVNLEEDRRLAGAICGATAEEVEQRIRDGEAAMPVEFAGWLPIFEFSGNCGRHPQFTQTAKPPPGYRFTCSAPPRRIEPSLWARTGARLGSWAVRSATKLWLTVRPLVGLFRVGPGVSLRARWRVLRAIVRLFFELRRRGARLGPILRFLQTRHFQSQLLIAKCRGLVFLTSIPYTYGQNPWVVEIEDPTTLFYPMIPNGRTSDLPLRESPYFPIIKTLLETDSCRGILTHMKSTAALVSKLFESDVIRAKVSYAPLGVKLPERWQRHEEREPFEPLNLVFINSWCQIRENFYVRGGLDVLEAFALLRERYPHVRLTLRTQLPDLDSHYHRIIESGWVRVIDRFLPADEMAGLLADSHIFLLPAARIHVVSLLQAMSYGLAVVTSDGWGIEEYVTHEGNGLIVRGRYGKTSWADEEAGMLREDYEPMYTSDPAVVAGIVEAVSRLVEDGSLRRRLGRAARHDVKTTYSIERWNEGLKETLDRAVAPQR